MTEKNAKLKLEGQLGPMVAAPDYPIEAVLTKLGVPYQIRSAESTLLRSQVLEVKPMEIPDFVFLDFMYGTKEKP